MTEIDQTHQNIVLFVLENGTDGFATVIECYRRRQAGKRQQAWAEIEDGTAAQAWEPVPAPQRGGDIDMAFPAGQPCLVFVSISSGPAATAEAAPMHDATTYFGKEIVKELPLSGGPSAPVVSRAMRHKLPGSRYHTVCSFELDGAAVTREMGAAEDDRPVTRFPIVFDFVDSDDGISPVFKKPRTAAGAPAVAGDLARLGHGGIHPRGGSSLVIFE